VSEKPTQPVSFPPRRMGAGSEPVPAHVVISPTPAGLFLQGI